MTENEIVVNSAAITIYTSTARKREGPGVMKWEKPQ
jgi:hypothetical protein